MKSTDIPRADRVKAALTVLAESFPGEGIILTLVGTDEAMTASNMFPEQTIEALKRGIEVQTELIGMEAKEKTKH